MKTSVCESDSLVSHATQLMLEMLPDKMGAGSFLSSSGSSFVLHLLPLFMSRPLAYREEEKRRWLEVIQGLVSFVQKKERSAEKKANFTKQRI